MKLKLPNLPSFRQSTPRGGGTPPSVKQTNTPRTLSRSSTNLLIGSEHVAGHALSLGNPSIPARPRRMNVVLFGEPGVGKSSVVNLIAGRYVAQVSSGVNRCTPQSTPYDISFGNMDLTIFEFIGLEGSQMTVKDYIKAIEEMYELIVKLGAAGGLHLLLFCMSKNRIKGPTQANYRLFSECLCSRKVPLALVFTGLEGEVRMEDWWTRNKTAIEIYGLISDGHACITTVNDNTPEEALKYQESQMKIRELLNACALRSEAFCPEQHSWFAKVGKEMKSFIAKHKNPNRKDVVRVLMRRCKLDPEAAKKIADVVVSGDTKTEL